LIECFIKIFSSLLLGGFPNSTSITNRTNNHFHKPFLGCLQGIQISNANSRVTTESQQQKLPRISTKSTVQTTTMNEYQDFSHFKGENIGECEFFDEFVNKYDNNNNNNNV